MYKRQLVILVITCAEITIVMCYFQLCAEDYNWWWRSFLTSGSSAGYMFAYSVFYFFTKLEITKFVSGLLYYGYHRLLRVLLVRVEDLLRHQGRLRTDGTHLARRRACVATAGMGGRQALGPAPCAHTEHTFANKGRPVAGAGPLDGQY